MKLVFSIFIFINLACKAQCDDSIYLPTIVLHKTPKLIVAIYKDSITTLFQEKSQTFYSIPEFDKFISNNKGQLSHYRIEIIESTWKVKISNELNSIFRKNTLLYNSVIVKRGN
jgi:hypothetical protein